jgi:hypothetical protein
VLVVLLLVEAEVEAALIMAALVVLAAQEFAE